MEERICQWTPHAIVPVIIFCFVAWRIFRRIGRHIGQQTFQFGRLLARTIIYSVILLVVSALLFQHPKLLAGIGGGAIGGFVLALIGLRLTKFETTPQGQFYTPNTIIGIGLAVLLVGRMIYRFAAIYAASSSGGLASAAGGQPGMQPMQSPLTLVFLGLLLGYYIAYYAGILIRCGRGKSAAIPKAPAIMESN